MNMLAGQLFTGLSCPGEDADGARSGRGSRAGPGLRRQVGLNNYLFQERLKSIMFLAIKFACLGGGWLG